jgi:hypothetical protein
MKIIVSRIAGHTNTPLNAGENALFANIVGIPLKQQNKNFSVIGTVINIYPGVKPRKEWP